MARPADSAQINARTHRRLPRGHPPSSVPVSEGAAVAAWPKRLHRPPEPLIGRQHEARFIEDLLEAGASRIVTVTGEPGIGKTRVALEVAASMSEARALRVNWVALESLQSAQHVWSTVAGHLGAQHASVEQLSEAMGNQQWLLVLDNFEHLLSARQQLAALVALSRGLRVLVTSRTPLRLVGERVVWLAPLSVSAPASVPETGVAPGEAMQLFAARAVAVVPDFRLDHLDTAAVVEEICRRLDGIPLAIELAAARLELLRTPRALLTRLDWGLLPLLVRDPATAPARQASMAAAIDWSYERLSEADQVLLRRLSVFEGSFTAGAAAAVNHHAAASATDDLYTLQPLLDSGLLQHGVSLSAEPRFRLRGVVREYARARLSSSAELDLVERRQVAWFVHLAEIAGVELSGRQQVRWLNRLSDEHVNLRAVLRWADENQAVDTGVRLASALRTFWALRARRGEGRAWLAAFAISEEPLDAASQARLLAARGALAVFEGDYGEGRSLLEGAWVMWTQLDHPLELAWTRLWLGDATRQLEELDVAADHYHASLSLFRDTGDAPGEGWALLGLAHLARLQRVPLRSWASPYVQALETWRRVGDRWGLATTLRLAADAAYIDGDFDRAAELYEECVALFRELGFAAGTAWALLGQGDFERVRNRYVSAEALFKEAVRLFHEAGDDRSVARAKRGLANVLLSQIELVPAAVLLRESMVSCLDRADMDGLLACAAACARVAVALDDARGAAQLLGASTARGGSRAPADDEEIQRTREASRRQLGDEQFTLAWEVGLELSSTRVEALCRAILGDAASATTSSGPVARSEASGLTAREREVVVLIARGLKDREIADALVMGRSTASWHVRNVLSKLRLSRAQIGVWALEKGLLKSSY